MTPYQIRGYLGVVPQLETPWQIEWQASSSSGEWQRQVQRASMTLRHPTQLVDCSLRISTPFASLDHRATSFHLAL